MTLVVCGEKNISPNLTNSKVSEPEPEPNLQGAAFFCPLEPELLEKIMRSLSRLRKKLRSRSRLKKNKEPEPEKSSPALV